MALQPLDLIGADVSFDPHWIEADVADALLPTLRDEIAWETHRIRLFGRLVDSPRLSCWIGDTDASYVYSRVRFDPHPWTPTLTWLRDRLQQSLGLAFNSVLANRYRDGRDAMGWHSDDERELGPQPSIASVSFGSARRFRLRRRDAHRSSVAIELGAGSLLLMRGETQRHWQHALPRTARPCGERINLTFRRIATTTA